MHIKGTQKDAKGCIFTVEGDINLFTQHFTGTVTCTGGAGCPIGVYTFATIVTRLTDDKPTKPTKPTKSISKSK
jgi:hypothetical protein